MSDIYTEWVEMDLPACSLSFGVSPCNATGTPCFNTRNYSHDCGDIPNFTPTTQTVRFVKPNGIVGWPKDSIPTLEILESTKVKSTVIDPAKTMGTRAQMRVNLNNCLSSLAGLDKNIIARDTAYNLAGQPISYDRGTFLGKFKAINPFIFGSEVRRYSGFLGGQFDVEHYVIDEFSGPSNGGGMSFDCVDFLKLTGGKKSQYPAPTSGQLVADMSTLDMSFTVGPVGIGDLEYPTSCDVAIGKESLTCTRSGDVFTVVNRASRGTLSEHKMGDTVQVVGIISSQTSAYIANYLITGFTPLDSSYTDYALWQEEAVSFQSALYSCYIVQPEDVDKLLNELIEQSGLIFYGDVKTRKIIFKVLRPVPSAVEFTESEIIDFDQSENQNLRVSQAWVYFNQRDPFLKIDDSSNYYSRVLYPSVENLYPVESIKKVFSRWIPASAQDSAVDLSTRLLQRYQIPPKNFSFKMYRNKVVGIGQGAIINHSSNENAFGDTQLSPAYITSVTPSESENKYTAQEFIFTSYTGAGGVPDVNIPIDYNDTNVNLRELYDTVRASLAGVVTITFTLKSGFFIGSRTNGEYSLTVGDFGAIVPKLVIEAGAYIVGAAGTENAFGGPRNGGSAINADYPVSIENIGTIGGGGGAGGQGNTSIILQLDNGTFEYIAPIGPCGAGYIEGDKIGSASHLINISKITGSKIAGTTRSEMVAEINSIGDFVNCQYSQCGDGGGLGQNGTTGGYGPGGLAGKAIVNNSNITWIATGTRLGAIE